MDWRRSLCLCVGALCSVALASCQDEGVHESALKVDAVISGRLYWARKKTDHLLLLLTDKNGPEVADTARTLVWPDRAVLAVSPPAPGAPLPTCAVFIQEATRAAAKAGVLANAVHPRPPFVIGLDTASESAVKIAASIPKGHLSAVIAVAYCPPQSTTPPVFCSSDSASATTPLVVIPDETRCTAQDVTATLGSFADARAIRPIGGRLDLLSSVVDQTLGSTGSMAASDLDLPVVEVPTKKAGTQLAIIYSGDGGWADIDKQVGEELSARGVAVVGFDTLKYFWRRKDPAFAAADIERIVSHYAQKWGRTEIILIGYSFGADILPFLWPHLRESTQTQVKQIALLGLGTHASFEITVGGWMGVPPEDAEPTIPAVQAMPGARTLCIYGEEESEDACPQLAPYGVQTISTPGNHHFAGDYKKLADIILAASRD